MKKGESSRVCIIGAGPSGITAAKHLLQVGHTNFVVYDKQDQVGGNWIYSEDPQHSSVYETSHIISSKRLSQYHDYPMPEEYPDYPGHEQLLQYFQGYADHFGVTDYIQFNTTVKEAKMNADTTWNITLADGSEEQFDYLIAANGHHWNPRYPDIAGEFAGEYMHSHYYRTHLKYKGKRVLVIGAGNSACDIAVDICRHAEFVGLSWRRGYYVIPKFMFGMPTDVLNSKLSLGPEFIRRRMNRLLLRFTVGPMTAYGLPKPDHFPTESHPILNSYLLDHLRHGNIHPRQNVVQFNGYEVQFEDGTIEEYDVVIPATGYKITFPFFDYPELDYSEQMVDLYLKIFHPKFPSLVVIGLTQPQGCIWPLSDTQSQLVANYIMGRYTLPNDIDKRIAKDVKHTQRMYLDTPRHSTEVDYHKYLKRLRKELPRNAVAWTD